MYIYAMDIYVTDNVSEDFYNAVKDARNKFPDYVQALGTPIFLGHTLIDISQSLRGSYMLWKFRSAMYKSGSNEIYMGEYSRDFKSGKLEKNKSIAAGIAHEVGHAFDRVVFNNPKKSMAYSMNPEHAFLHAWSRDLEELKENPSIWCDLDPEFTRHMESDGSGVRETFAEIWANAHGYCTLQPHGIEDIRPLWPECTEIVEFCIGSLD